MTPDNGESADDLTAQGVDAFLRGDQAGMHKAFDARGNITSGDGGESGAVEINSADDALSYIRDSSASGELLTDVIWGPYAATELGYAYAFADMMRQHQPGDYAKLLAMPDDQALDALRDMAKRGRALNLTPLRFNPGAAQMRHPDVAPANLADQATARDELEELLDKNPPGSGSYLKPAVQRRVRELHAAISGDQPIVGRGLRQI